MHFWDSFSQLWGSKLADADMFLVHIGKGASSLLSPCNTVMPPVIMQIPTVATCQPNSPRRLHALTLL